MKKVIFMIIALSFGFISTGMAADRDYMISRMWQRQEAGIEGVIQCFKNSCQPPEYKAQLLMIVSAETNLISYGISPKDRRLVSRLASDVRSMADFPAFAYRLFKKRLFDLTGFSPSPGGSFRGSSFRIVPKGRGISRPVTVSFR